MTQLYYYSKDPDGEAGIMAGIAQTEPVFDIINVFKITPTAPQVTTTHAVVVSLALLELLRLLVQFRPRNPSG